MSRDVIAAVLIEVWRGVELFDVPTHEQMLLVEIMATERLKQYTGESETGPARLDPKRHHHDPRRSRKGDDRG